jgi:hypothetical protein
MTIIEVPVLPFRAGRHLAAWIMWHTARISMLEDAVVEAPRPVSTAKRAKRRKR